MKRFTVTVRANQFVQWRVPPEVWLYDQLYRQVKKLTCVEVEGQCILCARHSCMWQQLVIQQKWPLFINESVSLFKRQAVEGEHVTMSFRLLEKGAKWSHLFHFALQSLAEQWRSFTLIDWREEQYVPTMVREATAITPVFGWDEVEECARYEALTGEPLRIERIEPFKVVQLNLPRLTSGRIAGRGEMMTVTLTAPHQLYDIGCGTHYYLGMGQFKRCD